MNLNSPPSHFPMHQISHDADHELHLHQPLLPNRAPSISCHFFVDSTQDHTGFYDHHHLYRPNHAPDYQNYGGSTYELKNKDDSGLELGLWKIEDDGAREKKKPMKWMSSKMRAMQKMKHTDHDRAALKTTSSADQKIQPSSSGLSSNSSSYNNSPIRVCSDCNTTKTPLWRSGPKGPKSLCNACGIRQRKVRRAMAAAAAAAATNCGTVRRAMAAAAAAAATNCGTVSPSDVKIKLQHKGKLGKNEQASHLKKRLKMVAGSQSMGKNKQIGFEDFLINLSKNLAFHRVFPDDEKDAAILLMALSSGLVNG